MAITSKLSNIDLEFYFNNGNLDPRLTRKYLAPLKAKYSNLWFRIKIGAQWVGIYPDRVPTYPICCIEACWHEGKESINLGELQNDLADILQEQGINKFQAIIKKQRACSF